MNGDAGPGDGGTRDMTCQKTWTPKGSDVEHRWFIVDAEGQTLGRLASQVAAVLRGNLAYSADTQP